MNPELIAVVLSNGSIELEWTASDSEKIHKEKQTLQQEIYRRFQKHMASALLFLGFTDDKIPLSVSIEFWRSFSKLFTKKLSQTPDLEEIREKIDIPLQDDEIETILRQSPFMVGSEYLDAALVKFLWSRLNSQMQTEIKEYKGTVEELIKNYSPNMHLLGKIYFHLVENKDSSEFPFAFLATYSTSLTQKGDSRHLPLKCALQEYENNDSKLLELLTTVDIAAGQSKLVADLLDSGEIFHPLAWKAKEAYTFLKEIPLYEQCGILCRIPNWWKAKSASFKVDIKVGNDSPKRMGMDALLDFDMRLLLGDQVITEDEARRILSESEGLAYIKGKWVEVNTDKLNQVLSVFEKAKRAIKNNDLTLQDALRLQLGMKELIGVSSKDDLLEVTQGDWLQSVSAKLQNPKLIEATDPGTNFNARLRPYQQDGLNWIHFLHSLQFGACLADDMGLGKTIQMLAFINNLKNQGNKIANLIVIPASLLANWQKEIDRFAPSLKYFIAHPSYTPDITKTPRDSQFLDSHDLVITTYALIQKYQWLKSHTWNYVILDEAQAIKNPGTKQTRAVKKLVSYNRVVMTGTPIENKIGDLWSIFDFINPGLIGSANEFQNFAKNLKDNTHGYARLREIISPYILRRLKTDKTVIADLPEKIEMKVYAELSKKQILLYKELVEDIRRALEEMEGIQRKGLILASLMKFKQICNHPGQYLGNGEFSEKDSGKFDSLREICQTIFDKREKVLVFTQFKEITSALHDFLAKIFGKEGLILHGGIAVKKRKELIERFQSKEYIPFFILSVKAGGVGLNLTEASHVIHFDRWWNPAVENQATDRAFRIGQKKNVVVHKFITRGTIEEKIDALLEEKSALSQQIIQSSGENWIMQMNNKEILDLFRLSL